MPDAYARLTRLLGEKKTDRLAKAKIAVFGLEAAGAFAAEALARCGVGSLTLVSGYSLSEEDIAVHPAADRSAAGRNAVVVLKEKIARIDPDILVHIYETDVTDATIGMFDLRSFDLVIDATTDTDGKLLLLSHAARQNVTAISCILPGGLSDADQLIGVRLHRAAVGPIAREMRHALRKEGIRDLWAVCSREKTAKTAAEEGAVVFVSARAGMLLAQEAVRILTAGTAHQRLRIKKRKEPDHG